MGTAIRRHKAPSRIKDSICWRCLRRWDTSIHCTQQYVNQGQPRFHCALFPCVASQSFLGNNAKTSQSYQSFSITCPQCSENLSDRLKHEFAKPSFAIGTPSLAIDEVVAP